MKFFDPDWGAYIQEYVAAGGDLAAAQKRHVPKVVAEPGAVAVEAAVAGVDCAVLRVVGDGPDRWVQARVGFGRQKVRSASGILCAHAPRTNAAATLDRDAPGPPRGHARTKRTATITFPHQLRAQPPEARAHASTFLGPMP